MPLLFGLGVWGLIVTFRRRAADGLARLRIPVLGAIAVAGGVMFYGYIAHRYTAEFLPALVVLERDRAGQRGRTVAGLEPTDTARRGDRAGGTGRVRRRREHCGRRGHRSRHRGWTVVAQPHERPDARQRLVRPSALRLCGSDNSDRLMMRRGSDADRWRLRRGLSGHRGPIRTMATGRCAWACRWMSRRRCAVRPVASRLVVVRRCGRAIARARPRRSRELPARRSREARSTTQPGDWYHFEPDATFTVDVRPDGEESAFVIDAPPQLYDSVPMQEWDRDWISIPTRIRVDLPPPRLQRARGARVDVRWHEPSSFCRRLVERAG